jgi:hypothetical protein
LSILAGHMRAEFFRPDSPDQVLGTAEWDGRRANVQADDPDVEAALGRVFRASAVALDHPDTQIAGTRGEVVAEPGDLEWFRAAARIRGQREGFAVRFVTEKPGGWDPALDPQTYGWAGRKPALPHEP